MRRFTDRFALPTLAVLNMVDALVSYFLFRQFGVGIEGNPLINGLITSYGLSQGMFLVVKLLLSGLMVAYWYRTDDIPKTITTLTIFGIFIYAGMFLHGAYSFLTI